MIAIPIGSGRAELPRKNKVPAPPHSFPFQAPPPLCPPPPLFLPFKVSTGCCGCRACMGGMVGWWYSRPTPAHTA